jgi:hypothetical protein
MAPVIRINDAPKVFWAWLAGFIDGDGCIGIYKQSGYMSPRLTFTQKDRAILDHIISVLGTGSIKQHTEKDAMVTTFGGDPVFQLSFGSGATRKICARVSPYLLDPKKRRRATEVNGLKLHKWGELSPRSKE